jgi:hypothetical protein
MTTPTQFPLSTVFTISLSQTPPGVGPLNTSTLAFFTADTPSPSFTNGYKIYFSSVQVGIDFGTSSQTFLMAEYLFAQTPNILLPGGYLIIIPLEVSETFVAALTRTQGLVSYFGAMTCQIESQVDMLAAGAFAQALPLMLFFVQTASASVDPSGSLDLLRTGGYTHSRGLYYDDISANALNYQAAYAGRNLSTVFQGSNTTQDPDLKQLALVQPDPNITPTILAAAKLAGADCYISINNYSCIQTSGANLFFDSVYNGLWFSIALQVAGFNYLAQTSTKVVQTQEGLDGLTGAFRVVCQQAITNRYAAPGAWNSSVTFGNQLALISNVAQFGYYIFALPIGLQSQLDRAARIAPLCQIAIKEAGSINSGSIIVNVNA